MNFARYQYCWLLSFGIFLTTSTYTSANTLEKFNADLRSPATFYLTKNTKSNRKSSPREYNFKAPDSKTISNTEQLIKARGYRVEVFGSESELLEKVRNIEPSAFIKGDTIQVGIFSQQANAEDLVRQLAVKGFWARIKLE